MTFKRYVPQILLVYALAGALHVPCIGQIPSVSRFSHAERLTQAEQFFKEGRYMLARHELEAMIVENVSEALRKNLLFLLVRTEIEERKYEAAFQWAQALLDEYPAGSHYPEALYYHAVSAYYTNRLDNALNSLNKFLSIYAEHSLLFAIKYWRGMCMLERGHWYEAEEDFRSCYQDVSSEYRPDALLGFAYALEQRGQTDQAIEMLEQYLSEFPSHGRSAEGRLHLALLLLKQERAAAALMNIKKVNISDDPLINELSQLVKAESYYKTNNFVESESGFSNLLRQHPSGTYATLARVGLAWSRIKQKKYEEAKLELDTLTRGTDSIALKSLYQSGVISVLLGKSNDARTTFETLTERFPYDRLAERAYFELGMMHYRAQRFREARRNFQFAARLFPGSEHQAESFRMLGEVNIAIGDFANAQSAFSRVRKLNPNKELLAAALFQEGVSLYHLGRFKSSAEKFQLFLQMFSQEENAAEAYVWKAEALYQDGKFEESERAYATSLRMPNNTKRDKAAYGLAWALFEQKKFSQAAAAFDRFIEDYSSSPLVSEASLRKADCYFFMRDYERASALYSALASSKSGGRTVEYAAFQLAMSYLQRGDTERGIRELRNFLIRFQNSIYNEVVQFNIAWTYFSKEQYTEAIAEFRAVLRNYPESQLLPRVYFNMGDAFYNLRQYDSARVHYQKILEDYPTSPLAAEAINGLQFAYEAEGRHAEALNVIEQFLLKKPEGTSQEELLLRKGDILFSQGDFAEAIFEYRKLLELRPSREIQAKAMNQLARAYELENNLQRAAQYYEQVRSDYYDTEIAPQAASALCVLYIKMKQYRNAVSVASDFEVRFPNSLFAPEVRYHSGKALLLLNDKNAAQQEFQATIEKYPTDIFADRSRLQIARLLQEKKAYQASLDTLENIVSRRSDDLAAEAMLLIGENYLLLKKTKDALQVFLDVSEQYTEFPLLVERALLGQGECYERLRDRKKARSAYQKAVETAVDPAVKKDAEERLRRLR